MSLIALTLLLGACDNGAAKGQVTIAGDKLYLPPDCRLERVAESSSSTFDFTRFDGKYPEYWPADFDLPDGMYLQFPIHLRENEVPEHLGTDYKMYQFKGLAPLSVDGLLEFLREECKESGYRETDYQHTAPADNPMSKLLTENKPPEMTSADWRKHKQFIADQFGPGHHSLYFESYDLRFPSAQFTVFDDTDMGGYTLFWGTIPFDLSEPLRQHK